MNTTTTEKSFRELAADPQGTIYHDEIKDGVRFIILRGGVSLTAYVGVPEGPPLAGLNYESIPLDCHGGLTWAQAGEDGDWRPAGWYWYGWDYAHSGDRSFYDLDERLGLPHNIEEKEWTVKDVLEDARWETVYDFVKLARLAEQLTNRMRIQATDPEGERRRESKERG